MLLEEERRSRDLTCDSLHCKLEALACQVESLQTAVDGMDGNRTIINNSENNIEDKARDSNLDALIEQERRARELACAALRTDLCKELQDMLEISIKASFNSFMERELPPVSPKAGINGNSDPVQAIKEVSASPKLDEQYLDALIEQERRARELACAGLRTELCRELQGMLEASIKTNMPSLLDQERRARDVACATLRTELCRELETLSMDVRSVAVRAPQFDSLERQQKDLTFMCTQMREDIQDLSADMKRRIGDLDMMPNSPGASPGNCSEATWPG
jgi:hypothetical protein